MNVTLQSPLRWRVAGQTVRGRSHERVGAPNQDALHWLPKEEPGRIILLAISDGHGSAKSFRSEFGARFAVDAMICGMEQFLQDHASLTPRAISQAAENLLPKSVVGKWRKSVEDHLTENPFTSEERERLKEKDGEAGLAAIRTNVALAYGATALGLVITDNFFLFLQLGDGDILVVSEDGQVTRPIPKDVRLFANQTTSLCLPDAWKDFQAFFQEMPALLPSLILLATDGYANSFRDESGFLQVGTDLSEMIRSQGWEHVTGKLETWLTEASRDGSGDDITVGLVAPALDPVLKNPTERNFLDFLPWDTA